MELWEIHPALVHFPIAFLLGAVVLDLYAHRRSDPSLTRMVTGLYLAGVALAALTALAGVLAFFTVPATHTEESGRDIWWHIGAAVLQFVLFAAIAYVRWRSPSVRPASWTRVLGWIAAVVLLYAGYKGGNLVYHGAMGLEPSLVAPELKPKSP